MMIEQHPIVNNTFEDIKDMEPPLLKLTKLAPANNKVPQAVTDNSLHSSISHEASTAIGRKDSIDTSQCSQCSEFLCVGDCASIDILNDAASNFSVASSEEQSEIDRDEISELWDMSSICTENPSCHKKVKFLQIKPMDECEEPSSVSISAVFEQIEKSSRIPLGLPKLASQEEESKLLWQSSGAGYLGQAGNIAPQGGIKQRNQRKQDAKLEERKSSPFEDFRDLQFSCWNRSTTTVTTNTSRIEEEERDHHEDPQGRVVPVADHDDSPSKPPMKRYETIVCMSFELMNLRIAESAKIRALKYLSGMPAPSQNGMLPMVAEVYRMLLLPEEALSLYLQCLGKQQRIEEGNAILGRMCPKVNRHPRFQQAHEKLVKFYGI